MNKKAARGTFLDFGPLTVSVCKRRQEKHVSHSPKITEADKESPKPEDDQSFDYEQKRAQSTWLTDQVSQAFIQSRIKESSEQTNEE